MTTVHTFFRWAFVSVTIGCGAGSSGDPTAATEPTGGGGAIVGPLAGRGGQSGTSGGGAKGGASGASVGTGGAGNGGAPGGSAGASGQPGAGTGGVTAGPGGSGGQGAFAGKGGASGSAGSPGKGGGAGVAGPGGAGGAGNGGGGSSGGGAGSTAASGAAGVSGAGAGGTGGAGASAGQAGASAGAGGTGQSGAAGQTGSAGQAGAAGSAGQAGAGGGADECAGQLDGDHCGQDLGAPADPFSVYTCAAGSIASALSCGNGQCDSSLNQCVPWFGGVGLGGTGTSGGCPNGFFDEKTDCGGCIDGKCCPAQMECRGEPDCAALMFCLISCKSDVPCGHACSLQYPAGKNFASSISQCAVQKCKALCGPGECAGFGLVGQSGNACGATLGGAAVATTLYTCSAAGSSWLTTRTSACGAVGCQQVSPGHAYCLGDPCGGAPNGTNCGARLGAPDNPAVDAGSLYTCAGGVTTKTQKCANSCYFNPLIQNANGGKDSCI